MNEPARSLAASSGSIKVEFAKNRCRSVIDRIQALPPSKITDSCKRTLIKLADSELKFLSRLSLPHDFSGSISVNVGYLESVVHVLQQPFISGVSRVCKPIPLSSPHGRKCDSRSKGIHVDIVCTVDGNPFWFIISDRNPKYITWLGSHRHKGLRTRVEHVLVAACSALTLKPLSVVLFFSNGINEIVAQKLQDEFGASEFQAEFSLPDSSIFTELEEEWVYVTVRGKPSAFQLNIDCIEKSELSLDHGMKDPVMGAANLEPTENHEGFISTDAFSSLISTMRSNFMGVVAAKPEAISGENLINFDTTALVALVSGISNGGAERLLTATESEMRKLFKNNVKFVMAQVMSELQNPILGELSGVLSCKRGVICESVLLEFKELVSMYAGPNEKSRADRLLKQLI
ncbi:uncharacterized protein LOC131236804 isoform X2 [Magnolia sinica]|uniref:uncharacterized protein LOC131236804 isoform X2 n=1 Tax=Magnolia sinica TaxID=86752 RepID=UPI0026586688|nr:uncharacterized protein LOC131236804 isoform X2 [Magnolia sinica]